MSDTPIVVHATPTKPQIEAGLRQFISTAGPLVALLAATGWGEKIGLAHWFSLVVANVSFIAGVVAIVWGQYETRKNAKKAAAMAAALPDSVATTK